MKIATISLLLGTLFGNFMVEKAIPDAPPLVEAKKEAQKEPEIRVIKSYIGELTAYTSREEETDDTPHITASGTYVRDGIVATNMLPIGTHITIPALFGGKTFVVEDRMHARHSDKLDIWFPAKAEAIRFGSRRAKIEVL